MSLVFTDGVPGQEGVLKWTTGHSSGLYVVLGARSATPSRVTLDDIPGLHGRADVEDRRMQKVGRDGELLSPVYESGRTIAPTGQVQARSALELRRKEWALNAAFEERRLEGTLKIYLPADTTHYWFAKARVIAFDLDERQETTSDFTWPFQRGYTLGLRCSDPRIYWYDPVAAGPNSTQVTVVNPGRDSNPLIAVTTSGSADFTIYNDTTGKKLKVQASDLGATKVVTFNFDTRVIWANDVGDTPFVDGEAITHLLLTAQSTWWGPGEPGIDRGSNTIRQSGATDVTVEFWPAV